MIIKVNPQNPQERLLRQAVEVLLGGGLIAYPTDTTYAIGCDLYNLKGIARIYQIKRRPTSKPFSFICHDLKNISEYAQVGNYAYKVMKRLLPGPYTFVLEASRQVPKILQTRRRTVGIRVPDHPIALELVRPAGAPHHQHQRLPARLPGGERPLRDRGQVQAAPGTGHRRRHHSAGALQHHFPDRRRAGGHPGRQGAGGYLRLKDCTTEIQGPQIPAGETRQGPCSRRLNPEKVPLVVAACSQGRHSLPGHPNQPPPPGKRQSRLTGYRCGWRLPL